MQTGMGDSVTTTALNPGVVTIASSPRTDVDTYLDQRVGELESRVNEIRRLVEAAAKPEANDSAGSAAINRS
jgi:hypothetical protein